MLLGFLSRILLARFFSPSEYGVFSLALAILGFAVTISALGLQEGSPRQIAYYRGKNNVVKVLGVITLSIQITLISSILLSVMIFLTSSIIATNIFHELELTLTLKTFSITIPFFVLIYILTSVFRGFDDVKPTVYFDKILRNGLFLLLLTPLILLNLPFAWAVYAFLVSIVTTGIISATYTIKKLPLSVKIIAKPATSSVRKELLLLSLPLLTVTMLNMIMAWTDTLMLGYFKTSDIVGLYNGALPLASLISIPLSSMGAIYVPITSQFFSKNLMAEMRRNYAILTKWIFAVSFPLFLLLFLFPATILSFLFGPQYAHAAIVLRILALGYFVHTFLGLNGTTLISFGNTRLLMWASLLSALLNVTLNATLIPMIGMIGAATSSAAALVSANIITSAKLYQISRIHPFTKNYLKLAIASTGLVFVIYIISRNFLMITPWMLPIIMVAFLIMFGFSLLLTKSFDYEDIMLLLEIEKRLGVNFSLVKRVLRRFLEWVRK